MTKISEMKSQDMQQVFRYARLAASYNQNKDQKTADELRKIEQELGMSATEIMDLAMSKTDAMANQSH